MDYKKQDKLYEEKVLEIARVSRTVKGGKRISFRAVVAVGDKNSKVGIAIGKGVEVGTAIKKGLSRARKNMITVTLNDNKSITREVSIKFGSSKVLLRPAPKGTSVIAGPVIRAIAALAGIENLVSKLYGSNNKNNTAQATIKGLVKSSRK